MGQVIKIKLWFKYWQLAIIWTNAVSVCSGMYASLSLAELTDVSFENNARLSCQTHHEMFAMLRRCVGKIDKKQ